MNKKRLLAAVLALTMILCVVRVPSFAMGTQPRLEMLVEPSLTIDISVDFTDGVAVVRYQDKGYGLIDAKGNKITDEYYDGIGFPYNGIYIVRKNGKYGAIDNGGKVIIEPIYDSLTNFQFGYAVTETNGVKKVISSIGALGALISYPHAEPWAEDLLRVWNGLNDFGARYGLVDLNGHVIVPMEYEVLGDLNNGVASVSRDGIISLMDSKGNIIAGSGYENILTFIDDAAIMQKNGMYGIVDASGKVLASPKYSKMERLTSNSNFDGFYYAEIDELSYMIDSNWKEWVLPAYDYEEYFGNGIWIAYNGRYFGLVDYKGQILRQFEYKMITPPAPGSGLANVSSERGHGCLDLYARVVVPAVYDQASFFDGDNAIVLSLNGKSGLADYEGNLKLAIEYMSFGPMSEGLRAVSSGDGLWGYMDENYELVIPFMYTYAADFLDGYAVVRDESTYFVIDKSNEKASAGSAYRCNNLGNGLFSIEVADSTNSSASLYGMIDKTGKELIPAKYSYMDRTMTESDDFILLGKDSYTSRKWGLADCMGKIVLEADYDRIVSCGATISNLSEDTKFHSGLDGLYWVVKDGKMGLISLASRKNIPTAWAEAHIERAAAEGLIPKELMGDYSKISTRAEFCRLAVRVYEKLTGSEIPVRMEFTDTNDENVEKMGGLNIVAGSGDGSFSPDQPLTREQAALILARLIDDLGEESAESYKSAAFSDMGDVSNWAKAAVEFMLSSGVMSGVGGNRFDPKGYYTREQCITTLLKVYDMGVKK